MKTAIGFLKKMEMCGNKSQIYLAYRMVIIHHNPTCLYNTPRLGSLLYSINTPDFYEYTANVRFFPSITKKKKGLVCNNSHLYDSNWTPHSSASFISTEKYEARNDEWHTACISVHLSSLGVDIKRASHPVFSSFS